ncbi:MAG: glutathione synthase [Polyangiales bacterium]
MKFLFLMDPMSSLNTAKDTTFSFLLSAAARGHESYHADALDLDDDVGELFVRSAKIGVKREKRAGGGYDDDWNLQPVERRLVADFDAIFIRKDPPFDAVYGYTTQLLERVRDRVLVVNDPRGLRDANEKLYALHFPQWTPRTLVSATPEQIRDFVRSVGGKAVIKPLDGMGGMGIFLLHDDDKNFSAILEATIGGSTGRGKQFCMVQEYLPAAREGDKRILLIDGQPLGAILRVPRASDARANLAVGGTAVKIDITATERAMIEDLAPRLRRDGLYFVGLDVIGGRLTEVNVTSPTGIQQMNKFDGVDYTGRVMEWVEGRVIKR